MSNEASEKGYGAGNSGAEKDNPYEVGSLDRVFLTLTEITGLNPGGLERADQAEKDWNDAYDAGVADRLSGR